MQVLVIIIGLILFEVITSVDNAIINADVLSRMSDKSRRWFLTWGILIAVFLVRGLLPFVVLSIFRSEILIVGGIFLILVFARWIAEGTKLYGSLRKRITGRFRIENDTGRIVYLELLDSVFSIDGVIGAFAFTMSIPLILIGNGIGAIIVRQLTIFNIKIIKKFRYLKQGAMIAILVLGLTMIMEGNGMHLPFWLSPVLTTVIIGVYLYKSIKISRSSDAY